MALDDQHSRARILAQLIVDLGIGTVFNSGQNWATHWSKEPDQPDNSITVYDATTQDDGRTMTDGERQEHPGWQVRVRATTHELGYRKAREIALKFDQVVLYNLVTIDSKIYLVHCINRRTDVFSLGEEMGVSKRKLFTFNGVCVITEIT